MAGRLWHGAAVLLLAALASQPTAAQPATAQPATVQPATAWRHMAATANLLATAAALSVLRDDGSAADAAVAGQMMLAVVEPQASGLGGGSLLLLWDAATGGTVFFDGLASAPAAQKADYAHAGDGAPIPAPALDRGGHVVAVPGTLRMLARVHAQYGRLPWARLFRDAIAAAEDGFAMPPYLHAALSGRRDLAGVPGFAIYFDDAGAALPVGATVRNPALAQTLRLVAEHGPDAFYTGRVAADIAAAVAAGPHPGTLTEADLRAYQPVVRAPVCLSAFDRRICAAAPPDAGGIAVLQMLAVLERVHAADAAPGSVGAAHLFLEASRLAEADRRAFMGDPDQVPVPAAGLLNRAYLDGRAALVRPDGTMARVEPGDPPGRHGAAQPSDPATQPATSHLAIIDDAGNAVSFTTTVNLNFGAGIAVDGVVLNDAVTNFAARPAIDGVQVANAAAPGKRPITTMAPVIVFGSGGKPELVLGAGGGARIIDAVAETVLGVLAWHEDVRTAVSQPRVGAQNRAQELEAGTAAAGLADALRGMGHTVKVGAMNAAVQAVMRMPDGSLQGWGDTHRDGVAQGD